ncbi:hypothetical protein Tco_0466404 [Tanacetum coccineum]
MKEESIGWFGSRSVTVTYTMSQVLTEAASIRFGLWTITGSILSSTLVIVNGVRFVVHSRDERRTTQNSGICSPGLERRNMVTHIDVDAPPDIIDVVDEDDDIIDEEDPIPHDLADSDDEDLVNLDIDDGVNVMSADVARGHDGEGGGDDRPPPYQVRAPESPIWGWQEAGRPQYRQEIPETWVKGITDKSGPSRIGLRPVDLRPHSGIRPLATNLCGHPATLQIDLQKMARRLLSKERYWVTDEDGTYDLMETSATREYPSLIHTFFMSLTLVRILMDRGHSSSMSDDKFSQMLNQFESQPEYGGGSGSGGCGDDELGDDEDGGEDEDDS